MSEFPVPDIQGSDIVLPFPDWGCSCPVQYEIQYGGHEYYIRYRHSWLTIQLADEEIFAQQLASERDDDGFWSDEATNVYLALISRAIRDGNVQDLELPWKYEITTNEFYRKGPYRGYDPVPNDGP
jgi:hypothetical protein